ncbi:MAG TPA: hypothetical protein VFO93_10720 [Hymenobacter sp.]|uniref:hypothetical protein n=1 Tax=Hymenobacter sp. TaxID=1898978 RepID=UPI002D7FCE14|nr:hypothetical protein [Hymenobacter sp.]HET9504006.1 hypothetical protein [Hymenobacter sp.]
MSRTIHCVAMKAAVCALLIICLSACRLSQPLPFVDAGSAAAAAAGVATVTPPTAGAAAVTITDTSPGISAKQAPGFPRRIATRQPKQAKALPLVRYAYLSKPAKNRQPIATSLSGVAASEPAISPGKSLLLAGIGGIIVLTAILIIPSITTFGGAIVIGFALALGVTFLLLGFFSYLLGLYEKGRVARADRPKK